MDRSYDYITEALKIASDLMRLADDGDIVGDNKAGILFGVMRDCAYKIRHQVEKEKCREKRHLVHI